MSEPRAVTISREDQPTRGRYVARMAGVAEEAELTFAGANRTVKREPQTRTGEASPFQFRRQDRKSVV